VHVEPHEREFRVRFRIDGVLQTIPSLVLSLKLKDAISSRVKIMAGMNITERRIPQDGNIRIRLQTGTGFRTIDFRVSTLPSVHGENIVLRLLDRDNLTLDMSKLGFEPESLEKLKTAIQRPVGMVLVTGPTGSGKTNTLYSAISVLNKPDVNIMTAEDPVEIHVPGIIQVQVREQVGLTFAKALRSFLRQDPDIILVGEMRDHETASIAVKAALTGHLVLSSLHTNDAPSTISRLLDMELEAFQVATSVQLICAQRLVRRTCRDCRNEIKPPSRDALIRFGFDPDQVPAVRTFRGTGCSRCSGTGYRGRIGLFEVMEINDDIREAIMVDASEVELKRRAIANGLITLRQSGLVKILEQITTIEEIARETSL
jgi:type IV pilus assembly protein PilB